MDWLVADDGRYLPLTAVQSLLLDTSATLEDLELAICGLRDTLVASRSIVADSRRRRRIRQSGLRVVESAD
jgi:hypothetical protein